ncbi:MAG: 16S rRNA (uracil(1498)-N(3))-methyltransferase [Chitinophagaceae bacterium]|nr:16S rRNA (uracil(1498)-N(3))-methyltransferase [Chitinophagaceae bacterium]
MLTLDENSSRHIAQVLRMQAGERLQLTNGEGVLLTAVITDAHKKHCQVRIEETQTFPVAARQLTLCVSLLKNAARIEWLLEKATEMGVHRIVPLLTHRTVREKFRMDRMQGILTSAMLQSQQCWLPQLKEPVVFEDLFNQPYIKSIPHRFIAHCIPGGREEWIHQSLAEKAEAMILIGPEGDFTPGEIKEAIAQGCKAVALGPNRLRTETAAMAAVAGYYLHS